MKKLFFALMTVAAITLTGCDNNNSGSDVDDPNAPENNEPISFGKGADLDISGPEGVLYIE